MNTLKTSERQRHQQRNRKYEEELKGNFRIEIKNNWFNSNMKVKEERIHESVGR